MSGFAALLLFAPAVLSLEFGIFMGLQYYGPPANHSVYERVAAAAKKVPVYVSMCADHNDTGGGAEHRTPDPGDGGRIVPICDLGDDEGAAVRRGAATLRDGGAKVLHYTHTRISYFPNGSEYPCCECCEDLDYVLSRVKNETHNFPSDGIFNDNSIANDLWLPYYSTIASAARRRRTEAGADHLLAFNPNCAHEESELCSPYCTEYGHSAAQCADCSSPHCSKMSSEMLDLGDLHILSEATVGAPGLYPNFTLQLPFEPSEAQRNKFAMFTYGATTSSWRGLVDAARSAGYTKFWVDGEEGGARTSFLSLPPWFDEMVEYIASLNSQPDLGTRSPPTASVATEAPAPAPLAATPPMGWRSWNAFARNMQQAARRRRRGRRTRARAATRGPSPC
jgi:hypothetical protein